MAYFKIPMAVVAFLEPYGVGPTSTGLIVAGSSLLIGMFIGLNLPQPDWARSLQGKVVELLRGLDKK